MHLRRGMVSRRPAVARFDRPHRGAGNAGSGDWGRDARIIPVAHAEALAARLPVHVVDAAGHLPHMEKTGEVNRLIERFFSLS